MTAENQLAKQRRARLRISFGEQSGRLTFRPPDTNKDGRRILKYVTSWAYQTNKYEDMASLLCTKYLAQLTPQEKHRFNKEDAFQGFRVISRILQHAPPAYRIYCQETQTEPVMASLKTILATSHRTPDLFAKMEDARCGKFEAAFGIASEGSAYQEDPFVIRKVARTTGPLFVPDPELWNGEISSNSESSPGMMCLARGQFMRRVWNQAIATCVTDPTLFACDLDIPPLSLSEVGV